ncbi:hypothetical protein [Leucothrix arctica]|uniref:Uncharacterized protein n=1 Tax=Leucothrix arctica TaxID=1481894 RepID=A0A317C4K1_9GAMM|nr:hypothetical protein [Leucothrix arctica]PWQ93575.1 hypothetical protein DKT75_18320 [Leucothrix arctica]
MKRFIIVAICMLAWAYYSNRQLEQDMSWENDTELALQRMQDAGYEVTQINATPEKAGGD